LQTLIIGLGRSGRGLHLPVIARVRAASSSGLFSERPIVVLDPCSCAQHGPPDGVLVAGTLEQAAEMMDPTRTVVHLCTPPDSRVARLDDLCRLGFKHVLVEKPLAVDEHDVAEIDVLRRRSGLVLLVVAPWLASTLTARIAAVLESGELGSLRAIYVVQRKPRFTRSLTPNGHPTAFDVEMPHSVGVSLALAGGASLLDAAWSDMSFENVVVLRMGGARLTLAHASGVRTEVRSDFTSMLRERRITLEFERGSVVGNYPASEADHASQLLKTVGLRAVREVFHDDAMTSLIVRAYEQFAAGDGCERELRLQGDVIRILSDAKRHCEGAEADQSGARPPADTAPARLVGQRVN